MTVEKDLEALHNDQDMLQSAAHVLVYTRGLLAAMRERYETNEDGRIEMMLAIEVMDQAVDALQWDVEQHGKHLDPLLKTIQGIAEQRGDSIPLRDAVMTYLDDTEYREYKKGFVVGQAEGRMLSGNVNQAAIDRLLHYFRAQGDSESIKDFNQALYTIRRFITLAYQLPSDKPV